MRVSYVQAMQKNPDVTYTQASAAVWSVVEINLGIMCNSLALLKPLMRRYLPRLMMSGSGRGSSPGSSGVNNKRRSAGKSNKPCQWSGATAAGSYQLHSIDRTGGGGGGASGGDDTSRSRVGDKKKAAIVRVDEYSVQFDGQGPPGSGDNASTDSILVREGNGGERHGGELV